MKTLKMVIFAYENNNVLCIISWDNSIKMQIAQRASNLWLTKMLGQLIFVELVHK